MSSCSIVLVVLPKHKIECSIPKYKFTDFNFIAFLWRAHFTTLKSFIVNLNFHINLVKVLLKMDILSSPY